MSDKLKNGFVELIGMLITALKDGGAFVAEQTPLAIQELLNWAIVKASLGVFLGFLMIVISLCIMKRLFYWRNLGESNAYYVFHSEGEIALRDTGGVHWGFFWLFSIVGSVIFCINLYKLMYVLIAPRVYLIEYLSKFI